MARKKTAPKKKPAASPLEPAVPSLNLTLGELMHLRDLFAVVLPPDGKSTVSGALADLSGTSAIEELLWQKIAHACKQTGIPTEGDAPDFVIANLQPPTLGVLHLELEEEPEENNESVSSPWRKRKPQEDQGE